jgi:hypothetical protein
VLAELAKGMAASLAVRMALFAALLLGAAWGGWTAGRWRSTRPRAMQCLRRLAGGVLMGWGSLLIPGGNDGLILVGMPLLWPYAWAAFLLMCLTIAAALLLARREPVMSRRAANLHNLVTAAAARQWLPRISATRRAACSTRKPRWPDARASDFGPSTGAPSWKPARRWASSRPTARTTSAAAASRCTSCSWPAAATR